MKNELLNEYAKLRAMDWLVAGDVHSFDLCKTFDRLRKIYKNLTIAELRKQIEAAKSRHQKEGVFVI
jgi:hypothetical protein